MKGCRETRHPFICYIISVILRVAQDDKQRWGQNQYCY